MHQATRDNQTTQAEVNVDGRSSLAERKRERQRELRKDPAYVEGQKIYKKIYQRIKIRTSNKEEAREQAVIARARYLQSCHSANEVV
ncbi:hypothetical protein [Endozoicomonas sp. GU-1]|uniref:hypothetical protein n=1 Tax=Endozoicomonas sp. GU-1 TaxID=3009078 RepID=UPI0022B4C1C0|nr:hypothetical protein [Endozoicomonas sp. GU-1]WBA83872.1 hypothetical protein O2T12_12495 [Endozoicomonas sp. GU-1]WBA86851.1 hypothetical protein O3276_02055 [Endozoicomonas sp. GU-1]